MTLALAAEMLVSAGVEHDTGKAAAHARAKLDDGTAADMFARMVAALGGPRDFINAPEQYLTAAPIIMPVESSQGGYAGAVDSRAIGIAVVELGGGRRRPEDRVDHRVGLTGLAAAGSRVEKGQPLALLHAADEASAQAAEKAVRAAYAIGDDVPKPSQAIIDRIDATS